MKDKYGITDLDKISDDNFESFKEMYAAIVKDVKQWLTKIINSEKFEKDVENLLNDKNGEFNKTSLSHYKSIFKVKADTKEWPDYIKICDGTENECAHFGWVVDLISNLIMAKYYMDCSDDGDEGYVYLVY